MCVCVLSSAPLTHAFLSHIKKIHTQTQNKIILYESCLFSFLSCARVLSSLLFVAFGSGWVASRKVGRRVLCCEDHTKRAVKAAAQGFGGFGGSLGGGYEN